MTCLVHAPAVRVMTCLVHVATVACVLLTAEGLNEGQIVGNYKKGTITQTRSKGDKAQVIARRLSVECSRVTEETAHHEYVSTHAYMPAWHTQNKIPKARVWIAVGVIACLQMASGLCRGSAESCIVRASRTCGSLIHIFATHMLEAPQFGDLQCVRHMNSECACKLPCKSHHRILRTSL
jgi:hypothetical protein